MSLAPKVHRLQARREHGTGSAWQLKGGGGMAFPGVGGRKRKQKENQSCTQVLLSYNATWESLWVPCRISYLPFIDIVSSFTLDHEPILFSDPELSMRKQYVPTER